MQVSLKQNSPEWLEYRKSKFNASEAGDVMGVGFNKPYRLAEIKYADAQTFQNEAMRLGHEYEPAIREYLKAKFHLDLLPVVWCSDDDERFSASLDGYDLMENAFCEIKFSDKEFAYLKEHGRPSDKYFYQIQHQYYVTGAKRCIFAVGRIDEDFELEIECIEVARDEKAIKELIKAWNKFEAEYKPSGALDDEWLEISGKLSELSAQSKAIEREINELKERAIAKAGGVEIKAYGLTIFKTERKPSYDYKAFCEHSGAKIPDEYIKAGSVSWSVRVAS
ncbi:YqaJ viral recombinase family protein [Campylobacter sp. RM6883]|uniref:lambda-exonuclease family protein n=1 Tax=Campylobacter californiensis TaxID=1032243 RepID=UPI0014520AA4|nr:YqaJ viral recombinase family protein [Campylobacter sp. RM6914]MBE2985321.1 YqaJ viral recombinase family protein [Campylobacter sp. RM6883]MBE2995854.1 YqaJ viral recombinase family protein [Campylobacter sp. RM6913]QCD51253.1 YqaJ-like viral recombinase domain protein [Campylobacter sp. RM6914]